MMIGQVGWEKIHLIRLSGPKHMKLEIGDVS